MQYLKLLAIFLMILPVSVWGLKAPMEIEVSAQEPYPDEEKVESESVEGLDEISMDETEVPYEDFDNHVEEQGIYTDEEEPAPMSLESVATTPVASNALLSLETTGSIFDQFAELERSKMLMSMQTEEEKMQLERDQVRLKRLKLQKELEEFEGSSSSSESSDSQENESEDESDSDSEETEEQVAEEPKTFTEKYIIKAIMGVGKNLIAVLENTETETKTRVKIGTEIEGYTVRKIQPQKGIDFEKDGKTEEINIQ